MTAFSTKQIRLCWYYGIILLTYSKNHITPSCLKRTLSMLLYVRMFFSRVFVSVVRRRIVCVLAAVVNLAVDGSNVSEVGARARVLRVVGSLMFVRARVIIKGVANNTGTCILKENCCKVRWTWWNDFLYENEGRYTVINHTNIILRTIVPCSNALSFIIVFS